MNFRNALTGSTDRAADRQIARRVRAELGRVSSHSDAIDVCVTDGEVTLRGPVLNVEVADILNGVESVHGVREVHYELDGYGSAEELPTWQELRGRMTHHELNHGSSRWMPAAGVAVAGVVATGAWAMMRARA